MKKIMLLLAAGIMGAALVACGKEVESNATVESEVVQDIAESKESQESQTPEAGTTETEMSTTPAGEEQNDKFMVGNVDNFSVDSQIVADFGKEVKSIVADKDLEALADLMAFPVYIGSLDGGVNVETREDFIALGEDTIFTQEMVDAMSKADENSLSASRAGFSLTDTGRPNIIFGVTGGRLAIQGMNY